MSINCENNKLIKVLQINAGTKNYGGVSAMVFEIYKNIDRKKFQFDFVSPMKTTYEIKRQEIEELGGNIIELNTNGNLVERKIQLYSRLKKLIKKEKYQIVQTNSGAFFFNLEIAIIAKMTGVKRIIIHSHNGTNPTQKIKNVLKIPCKPLLKVFATDFLTCSKEASENIYTKRMIKKNEIITIPNGIDTAKYQYNETIAKEYKNKLNIEGKIVIGNIGRFMKQKNHKFLLDVFKEFSYINNNAVLLLIGEGKLKPKIEDYAKKIGINKNILFLGLRKDIPNLLMCMDCFVLTSFYEGLPVVGVGAQASGLPIILSDTITKEVNLSENVKYISLKEQPTTWANEINNILSKENDRELAYENVKKKGFDIENTAKKLEEIYLKGKN